MSGKRARQLRKDARDEGVQNELTLHGRWGSERNLNANGSVIGNNIRAYKRAAKRRMRPVVGVRKVLPYFRKVRNYTAEEERGLRA